MHKTGHVYRVKQVGPRLPLPLPSTEAGEMLLRSPRLCKSPDLAGRLPLRPCSASSPPCIPHRQSHAKAPVASGRLLPELLPLPAPGEPPLGPPTALPEAWAAWVLGLCETLSSSGLSVPCVRGALRFRGCGGLSSCDSKTTDSPGPGWQGLGPHAWLGAVPVGPLPCLSPGQVELAAQSLSHVPA